MKGITSNFDLIKLAKKMNIDLTAVIYKDDLKRFDPKKNGSYIIDLHDHDNTSTGHWLMLYIKGNKAIYFDSFGIIYPTIIKEFCFLFVKQLLLIRRARLVNISVVESFAKLMFKNRLINH